MPNPVPRVRADGSSTASTSDKAGQAAGQAANAEQGNCSLPARVVVELPDGDILLGEDSGRLAHEQPAPSTQPQVARAGAQPGSEQWLELRRLLYATGLEATVLTRKRATSIILGVDLVYMLMTVATIAFRSIDTSGARLFSVPVILALNIFGALLDCVTIVIVVQQRHRAMRVLTITHTALLVVIGPGSLIAIALIRILLIGFLSRLLAALVELQWVVTALPLTAAPKPAWIQGALLGVNLSSLRGEYFSALQQMARQQVREADGGGTEMMVHTVQVGTSPQRSPSTPSTPTRPDESASSPMFERDVAATAAAAGSSTPAARTASPAAAHSTASAPQTGVSLPGQAVAEGREPGSTDREGTSGPAGGAGAEHRAAGEHRAAERCGPEVVAGTSGGVATLEPRCGSVQARGGAPADAGGSGSGL
eukprot:jgi/Ulvmu1/8352/UM042_0058.1